MTVQMNLTRKVTLATWFAAVLLGTCLSAGSASAQSVLQDKFTLRYSVRWGQAVLPAGDYLITIDSVSSPFLAIISDPKSGKRVAFVSCGVTEDAKGASALFVSARGNQHVVHTFRVEELGQSFIFDPALAHARKVDEAGNTEIVPVLQAKK
jgi:hypothetical protein